MRRDVLVVDDERALVQSLASVLRTAGYEARTAGGGAEAVEAVRERRPDLVLLDVMMPGLSGLETCRRLRAAEPRLPIVFLTALDEEEDELRGLESGANGYISKSVADEVLLARIAALIRLCDSEEPPPADFEFGDWRVEAEKLRMVRASGREELLTEREVAVLRLLASSPGTVFSRDAVITRLWGLETEVTDNALSTFVYVLRKKLGRSGGALVSVRGSGYAYRP